MYFSSHSMVGSRRSVRVPASINSIAIYWMVLTGNTYPQLVLPQVTVIDSDDIGVVGSSLKCELVLDVLDA